MFWILYITSFWALICVLLSSGQNNDTKVCSSHLFNKWRLIWSGSHILLLLSGNNQYWFWVIVLILLYVIGWLDVAFLWLSTHHGFNVRTCYCNLWHEQRALNFSQNKQIVEYFKRKLFFVIIHLWNIF